MLPLAGGHCNVSIFLVPGEEAGEGQAAIVKHGAGQQVELCPSGTHQVVGTAQVDEEPLLEKVPSVVGKEGSLADKLHPALNFKLWLPRGQAVAMQLCSHS